MPPSGDTIIFVCTANICRSPMAGALLAHALGAQPEPLHSLRVASAGVSAWDGDPASAHSVTALRKVGIDLSAHRSRRLTQNLVDRSLAIFCMTETHRRLVDLHFHLPHPHLYLMREWMPDPRDREIPDPFGLDLPAYESTRDAMVEAIPPILKKLPSFLPPAS